MLQVIHSLERDPDSIADCYLYVCEQLCRNRFRRLGRFRSDGPATFRTWLCVVVRNLSLDWQRHRHGRGRTFESIARLPSLDQELFAALHERGFSGDEAISWMASRHPDLSRQQLEESRDRLFGSLTSRPFEVLGGPGVSARGAAAKGLGLEEAPANLIPDLAPTPESQAVVNELHAILQKAVGRLDSRDRLLIQLRFEQSLTLEQVARITGLRDAQTADRRIRAVLERLREEFL
jgi:RNA polymerase sigma factor (sigma-70 family)